MVKKVRYKKRESKSTPFNLLVAYTNQPFHYMKSINLILNHSEGRPLSDQEQFKS